MADQNPEGADEGENSPASSGLMKVANRLFDSRTILIHGEITSKLAQAITAQLLALAAESDEPITIFLHSEAGTSRPATRSTT